MQSTIRWRSEICILLAPGAWSIFVFQAEILGIKQFDDWNEWTYWDKSTTVPHEWYSKRIHPVLLGVSNITFPTRRSVARFPFCGSWLMAANGKTIALSWTKRQRNNTCVRPCTCNYLLCNPKQIVLIGFQILMTQESAPINCQKHYIEGTVSYRINGVFLVQYCSILQSKALTKDTSSSIPRHLTFPFCFGVFSLESQTVHCSWS